MFSSPNNGSPDFRSIVAAVDLTSLDLPIRVNGATLWFEYGIASVLNGCWLARPQDFVTLRT